MKWINKIYKKIAQFSKINKLPSSMLEPKKVLCAKCTVIIEKNYDLCIF